MMLRFSLSSSSFMQWQTPSERLNFSTNPYKSWLVDGASLTKKLMLRSQGQLAVQRLSQRMARPRIDEASRLGLAPRELAFIREVVLLCHGQPWVYARSIIPQKSLQGRFRFLQKLKDDSLGAQLFKHPSLKRQYLEVAQAQLIQFIHSAPAHPTNTSVHARRSVFSIDQKEILVSEVFLPPCLSHNAA